MPISTDQPMVTNLYILGPMKGVVLSSALKTENVVRDCMTEKPDVKWHFVCV